MKSINKAEDLIGREFGELTVIKKGITDSFNVTWVCMCSCGTEVMIPRDKIASGVVTECFKCQKKPKHMYRARGYDVDTYCADPYIALKQFKNDRYTVNARWTKTRGRIISGIVRADMGSWFENIGTIEAIELIKK